MPVFQQWTKNLYALWYFCIKRYYSWVDKCYSLCWIRWQKYHKPKHSLVTQFWTGHWVHLCWWTRLDQFLLILGNKRKSAMTHSHILTRPEVNRIPPIPMHYPAVSNCFLISSERNMPVSWDLIDQKHFILHGGKSWHKFSSRAGYHDSQERKDDELPTGSMVFKHPGVLSFRRITVTSSKLQRWLILFRIDLILKK